LEPEGVRNIFPVSAGAPALSAFSPTVHYSHSPVLLPPDSTAHQK
jgi:hypothetical protein